MERGGTVDAPTATSAVQDVEKTFGLSVVSIINLHDLRLHGRPIRKAEDCGTVP